MGLFSKKSCPMRPEEFKKRLDNFIRKTRENKLIVGYGGVEKYYSIGR